MFKLWLNLSMLAAESQRVIWLRTMRLATGGPPAHHEAKQMVAEKVSAGLVATGKAMRGVAPIAIVKGVRKKVQANARRLSR